MTDRATAAPASPQSLPVYGQPAPREAARQHIVIMQSALACAPFVGNLGQPVVLNADNADFVQRLDTALDTATVGSHVYLMGDEAFIWEMHAKAKKAGLLDDEIDMTLSAAGARRVYCVHCGLTQIGGPAAELQCAGCGIRLDVREHFSKRLGAYLGVCQNADQPYAGARP
ncbi:MAG TPA: dimethylamine monooxygenase subunit DmmA family protein [Pseudomonas sp.]|uniref:dimethylamine monooxygenase subunit DmmA family protein n=1 Tax=Pseudomonas sp. TaxID=306 RepID=UPI002ED7DCB6